MKITHVVMASWCCLLLHVRSEEDCQDVTCGPRIGLRRATQFERGEPALQESCDDARVLLLHSSQTMLRKVMGMNTD